jgi:hypothetical protein
MRRFLICAYRFTGVGVLKELLLCGIPAVFMSLSDMWSVVADKTI